MTTPTTISPVRMPATRIHHGGTTARPHGTGDADPGWLRTWRPAQPLGPCPPGGIDLRLLLDESGSVTSHADPIRYRHAVLTTALKTLARTCTCRHCTATLTTFDLATHLGPVPLNRRGTARLAATLHRLPATSSNLHTALAHAERQPTPPAASRVVLVISDFELFDPPGRRIYPRLAALHATPVFLGGPPPPELSNANLTALTITATSPPAALADALIHIVSPHRPTTRPPSGPPPSSMVQNPHTPEHRAAGSESDLGPPHNPTKTAGRRHDHR
jgi:hypothetical protein